MKQWSADWRFGVCSLQRPYFSNNEKTNPRDPNSPMQVIFTDFRPNVGNICVHGKFMALMGFYGDSVLKKSYPTTRQLRPEVDLAVWRLGSGIRVRVSVGFRV